MSGSHLEWTKRVPYLVLVVSTTKRLFVGMRAKQGPRPRGFSDGHRRCFIRLSKDTRSSAACRCSTTLARPAELSLDKPDPFERALCKRYQAFNSSSWINTLPSQHRLRQSNPVSPKFNASEIVHSSTSDDQWAFFQLNSVRKMLKFYWNDIVSFVKIWSHSKARCTGVRLGALFTLTQQCVFDVSRKLSSITAGASFISHCE